MNDTFVKVFIKLETSSLHTLETESVWAEPLSDSLYQIRNVPFYAKGINLDDVVRTVLVGEKLFLESIEQRSGHSTYRFFTMDGITDEQWMPYWKPLEELGCTFERGTTRLFSVDIPPDADIYRAYELLNMGEKSGIWGFEEGHCGHLVRE